MSFHAVAKLVFLAGLQCLAVIMQSYVSVISTSLSKSKASCPTLECLAYREKAIKMAVVNLVTSNTF